MTLEVQVIRDSTRLVARAVIERILLGMCRYNLLLLLLFSIATYLFVVFFCASITDIRIETHLTKDSTSSNNSNYGSRGALAWTPPTSMEGSTPTWTEGTPSFTESSGSSENGDIGRIIYTKLT